MNRSLIVMATLAAATFSSVTAWAQCPNGDCGGGRWRRAANNTNRYLSQPRDHSLHPDIGAYGVRTAYRLGSQHAWNGNYAHWKYNAPVSLIVPPTAQMKNSWSWGVNSSRMVPMYHQYGRSYPGAVEVHGGSPYLATPTHPSHTNQFGVYPIRSPW